MRSAVIIGSTGLVGKYLLQKLVLEGEYAQVFAVVRASGDLSNPVFKNPKVRILKFDFQNWNELEMQLLSFLGSSSSSFFCCLGTTIKSAGNKEKFSQVDYHFVLNFANLAKSCRAENLQIVSALGADKKSKVFYNHVKGEMEDAVLNIYPGKVCFARPSLLIGDRDEFRLGERLAVLLAPLYSVFLIGPLKKYKPVSAKKVADALYLMATNKLAFSRFLENEFILSI